MGRGAAALHRSTGGPLGECGQPVGGARRGLQNEWVCAVVTHAVGHPCRDEDGLQRPEVDLGAGGDDPGPSAEHGIDDVAVAEFTRADELPWGEAHHIHGEHVGGEHPVACRAVVAERDVVTQVDGARIPRCRLTHRRQRSRLPRRTRRAQVGTRLGPTHHPPARVGCAAVGARPDSRFAVPTVHPEEVAMPPLVFRTHAPDAIDAGAVAVFAAQDGDRLRLGQDARALGQALGIDLDAELAALRFTGDRAAVARLPTRGQAAAPIALIVGVGAAADLHGLRAAAGAAVRAAAKDERLAVVVPADLPAGGDDVGARTAVVVEGVTLGAYAFTAYKTKAVDVPSVREVAVLAGEGLPDLAVREAIEPARHTADAVCLARDLVNLPPHAKRPPELAALIAERAEAAGLEVTVLDEAALAAGGFGGILGVGQGSSAPPRLVELRLRRTHAAARIVLIGKGITFDTGGVSLKTSSGMATMKMDMAGAATVVATAVAAAQRDLPVDLTVLAPLAENMPSGSAQRVSDVLTQYGGKTVEVMNTDAEGRLVLADALAYAAEREPTAMIDVATLTGGQIVALGKDITALMGTDEDLLGALEGAATVAGEPLWRLPLSERYRDMLDSDVADLKNIGKAGEAPTIVAGLFLKEFTAGLPWAHLDVAGPAYDEQGHAPLQPKGGTGVLVRTLLGYLAAS